MAIIQIMSRFVGSCRFPEPKAAGEDVEDERRYDQRDSYQQANDSNAVQRLRCRTLHAQAHQIETDSRCDHDETDLEGPEDPFDRCADWSGPRLQWNGSGFE